MPLRRRMVTCTGVCRVIVGRVKVARVQHDRQQKADRLARLVPK